MQHDVHRLVQAVGSVVRVVEEVGEDSVEVVRGEGPVGKPAELREPSRENDYGIAQLLESGVKRGKRKSGRDESFYGVVVVERLLGSDIALGVREKSEKYGITLRRARKRVG